MCSALLRAESAYYMLSQKCCKCFLLAFALVLFRQMEQLLSYACYKTQNLCSTAGRWLLTCSGEFAAFNFDERPFAKGKMISILFFLPVHY